MIDNKGKLFGKISIVDLLIVLLVVVAIGATVFKFGFSAQKDVNESTEKIEYVVRVRGVRDFTVNSIKVGTELYDEESEEFIGTVKKVDVKEAMDYAVKNDGTTVYTAKPERYDVYITVESDGRILNGAYFVGGTKEISAFSSFAVSSQYFSFSVEVQSVKQIG